MLRAAALALLVSAAPVAAGPTITETVKYYTITGDSFAQIRRQMARRGPNGFWAYTRWWINWSRNCNVDVDITIQMPRLSPKSDLTDREWGIWNDMVSALMRHERLHAANGIAAAREIHSRGCQRPHQIIKRWSDRDKALDRETNHGASAGVRLPN